MMQWIAAGDGLNMNYRWSQTKRTERNRQEELYLEGLFPFANVTTYDPISRTTDWRYKKCERNSHVPAGSRVLLGQRVLGEGGVADDARTRPGNSTCRIIRPHALTICWRARSTAVPATRPPRARASSFSIPFDPHRSQRALWEDLDDWSTRGVHPPHRRFRSLRTGLWCRLYLSPKWASRNIPGVTYTGLKTTRYRFNYGTSLL